MSFKFGKKQRLLSSNDFSYLRDNPLHYSTSNLRVFYKNSMNARNQSSRLGVSVSKKVGNAVKRNAIKRRIRESFRLNCSHLLGKDLLIVASPRLKKIPLNNIDLSAELAKLFNKVHDE